MSDPGECAGTTVSYNVGLHVGAVFIILAASIFGVLSVLAGKYVSRLRLSPFVVCLGKTAGTGIILACALVHMLQPSNESLTSPCVPTSFNTDYNAYAYLFAMLSAMAMQTVVMCAKGFAPAATTGSRPTPDAVPVVVRTSDERVPLLFNNKNPSTQHAHISKFSSGFLAAMATEFGLTLHSIFIGLAVGVAGDDDTKALVVALSFHQFFEGVSLGARLYDSTLSTATDSVLAFVFAVAAPIGIGAGVGVVGTGAINLSGSTFLLVQGTFDGICAGLLLHIGFTMLVADLPADIPRVVRMDDKRATTKRIAIFAALWGGAGIMAFIGKYL
jgi:zinc transporter 1/2/3